MEDESYYKFECRHHSGQVVTIRLDDADISIERLCGLFSDFAIACGFSRETVNKYMGDI